MAGSMELTLLPSQVDHVARLRTILAAGTFALDLSVMGCGKTYTTSKIGMDYTHVVVVAPVSVQAKWAKMQQQFGLPIVANLSYASLRGTARGTLKNGLLTRHQMGPKERPHFESTQHLLQLCQDRTLFIFDECQHLKNDSSQTRAAAALVTAAKRSGLSKVLLLSGSPFDKREHVFNFLNLLDIIPSSRGFGITRYDRSQYQHYYTPNARNFLKDCCSLDKDASTYLIHTRYHNSRCITPYRGQETVYYLFQTVFKPSIQSAMALPPLPVKVLKFNAFYSISPDTDNFHHLARGVADLQRVYTQDRPDSMMAISAALKCIEQAKVDLFAHIVRNKLGAVDSGKGKVVVAVNFSNTIATLTQTLQKYQPLVLDGSVNAIKRADIIQAFREDPCKRLLISNLAVCSTGIDLDDKVGDAPRFCLVSPTYSTIALHQLGHRFMRTDTRSDAHLHMVYVHGAHEASIIAALSRKSGVMKETTPQQRAEVTFPGDFAQFDATQHAAAATIQAAFRAFRWRKNVRDNPHTPEGRAWLTMLANWECRSSFVEG